MSIHFAPAFPSDSQKGSYKGMTQLSLTSALVLQGIMSGSPAMTKEVAVKRAVEFADALLAELSARETPTKPQ